MKLSFRNLYLLNEWKVKELLVSGNYLGNWMLKASGKHLILRKIASKYWLRPNGRRCSCAEIAVTKGTAMAELHFREDAPVAKKLSRLRLILFFIIAGLIFPRHSRLRIWFAVPRQYRLQRFRFYSIPGI
jgi:hypothetical protein